MNRLIPKLVLTLVGLMLVAGCNKSDFSSPQGAAEAFAKAMEAGDAEGAKAASTGADPKTIESLTKVAHAFKSLREAAKSKYGDKGSLIAGPGAREADMTAQIKEATVKEDGDKATLTPKAGGSALKLKKVDGKWKVDAGEMAPAAGLAGGFMDAMAKAAQETADEINAGKHAKVEDAKKALDAKILGGAFKDLGKKS